jgi:hypothetical protein
MTINLHPHSDLDLFRMFNVPIGHGKNGQTLWLWSIRKRSKLSRGEKNAMQDNDYCTISEHPPGSEGRIADLQAHYQGVEWDTEEGDHPSAFDIPDDA